MIDPQMTEIHEIEPVELHARAGAKQIQKRRHNSTGLAQK